jgi:hypothetical protein
MRNYAVLMALADICVEQGKDHDGPLEFESRRIAEKFILEQPKLLKGSKMSRGARRRTGPNQSDYRPCWARPKKGPEQDCNRGLTCKRISATLFCDLWQEHLFLP